VEDALERDNFMTADTAREFGLIDKVVDKRPVDTTGEVKA
jgi:ATP-dependent Clp protease protease subunit